MAEEHAIPVLKKMISITSKSKRKYVFLISGLVLFSSLIIVSYLLLLSHQSEALKLPITNLQSDFESIENPYKDKYVIFFNFDLKREAQRQILTDFPEVEYISNGIFPQVALVRIEKGAPAMIEELMGHQEINWVVPEESGMICH
jgi:hypothetical protein|tara:strand:+ start:102 stop:536 length:435 start_codon:yes stop_codon:yes gene_type:complete